MLSFLIARIVESPEASIAAEEAAVLRQPRKKQLLRPSSLKVKLFPYNLTLAALMVTHGVPVILLRTMISCGCGECSEKAKVTAPSSTLPKMLRS